MANAQKTQKEMYAYIAELLADNPEVVDFCNHKIEQLDNRKTAPRKANPEVEERRAQIRAFLEKVADPLTVKDIADALGFSSPQVTGALRGLVNAGEVEVVEPEQKSKAKMYRTVGSNDSF